MEYSTEYTSLPVSITGRICINIKISKKIKNLFEFIFDTSRGN